MQRPSPRPEANSTPPPKNLPIAFQESEDVGGAPKHALPSDVPKPPPPPPAETKDGAEGKQPAVYDKAGGEVEVKKADEKPAGDKPAGDKPAGDKAAGDKAAGDKPAGGDKAAEKADDKAAGDKKDDKAAQGEKDENKPADDKVRYVTLSPTGVAPEANSTPPPKNLPIAFQESEDVGGAPKHALPSDVPKPPPPPAETKEGAEGKQPAVYDKAGGEVEVKKADEKPAGDKPAGDKPAGDKPAGDKAAGDKPAGGDKPAEKADDKAAGDKKDDKAAEGEGEKDEKKPADDKVRYVTLSPTGVAAFNEAPQPKGGDMPKPPPTPTAPAPAKNSARGRRLAARRP
ncbi:MAG: hypothetical protein J3K34DRAFT_475019 [Monoraphidium minutum]|nr:MAG: hypothetical protein J3K34DRAFT_475019 [Monoraphidium minutum]